MDVDPLDTRGTGGHRRRRPFPGLRGSEGRSRNLVVGHRFQAGGAVHRQMARRAAWVRQAVRVWLPEGPLVGHDRDRDATHWLSRIQATNSDANQAKPAQPDTLPVWTYSIVAQKVTGEPTGRQTVAGSRGRATALRRARASRRSHDSGSRDGEDDRGLRFRSSDRLAPVRSPAMGPTQSILQPGSARRCAGPTTRASPGTGMSALSTRLVRLPPAGAVARPTPDHRAEAAAG